MNTRLAMSGLLVWAVCGNALCAEPLTLRSHSGQFLVRGLPLNAPRQAAGTNAEISYVRLDPTLLAVSCERIKSAVLEELTMKDRWHGKIYISLHPVFEDQEPIDITSLHHADGWTYRMEIPEQVDGARLVRAVVQVLLLEIANRNAPSLQAEIPLWLTEGLAAHLQATALSSFTLEPQTRIARKQRHPDPLARARDELRGQAPLTFNELNWPAEDTISAERIHLYQSCAQLFVHQLLRLRDGRACLREMLTQLPDNLNWQIVFLRAFSPYFQRLIDVDKWWSLHVVHLTGQGQMSAWVPAESCKQLDDILTTAVQVRLSPQELPLAAQVKLQSILAQWDFQHQRPLLLQKLNLLSALRRRASADSARLVGDYLQTVDAYVQKRSAFKARSRKAELSPAVRLIITETTKRLDQLDTQRDALRQQANPPAAQFTNSR